jgi:hypothetical protein
MNGVDLLAMFGSSGGSGGGLVVADAYISGTTVTGWLLGSEGFTYYKQNSGLSIKSDPWVSPQIGMELYEVNVGVAGDTPSGTVGAWVSLGTTREWTLTTTYPPKFATLTVQIRLISNHAITKTVTVTLDASGIA